MVYGAYIIFLLDRADLYHEDRNSQDRFKREWELSFLRREPGPDCKVLGVRRAGGGAGGGTSKVADQWSISIPWLSLSLSLRWASQQQVGSDLE